MRPTPLLRSCGPRTLASMAMTAPGQSPAFLPAIAPSPASPPALDLAKLMGDTLLRLDEAAAGGIRAQSGLRKMACDWQAEQATPPDVGRIVAALL